ncbi:hypothetical protein N431DRAFT_469999 [Stipitochalara longipes BDJ]|nr:hypothetical protein N431DRAFT_469999 [Stipitochalara longipes BDJ]
MENNKNTILSGEDEKRDMNGTPSGWVDVENHGELPQEAAPSNIDNLLDEYIIPTPYLDEEARLRDPSNREYLQETPEGIQEYQILGSDDSGEVEDEDSQMFRPTLANKTQQPLTLADEVRLHIAESENEKVLTAKQNQRCDRIWAYYIGLTYREDKIKTYINEGLSPEGAANQADVMFRARVLPVFEDRAGPGNPELAAFMRGFPLGTLEDNLELYRPAAKKPEEDEEIEPLIPKATEDKVWETWCVFFDLTSNQIADFFKENLSAEEREAYQLFKEEWLETFTVTRLTEAEALDKLEGFCAWAICKHKN